SSEGYQSRAGCLTAIERIRTGAATATFEDLSGAK
ncbi:MAG: YegP family protein, partial [Gemmatimonadales bacterium]|nr:YegP family protein [Gemmatimonadales bacterium]